MSLGLPIIGGMVSQNILNIVDTLMVSRLGPEAVAAVGIGSFVNFLAAAFITGLSTGVQAIAARRKGEGREGEMAVPLNGGLLMATVLGVPLAIACIAAMPVLFPLLNGQTAVIALAVPYIQVRLLSMPAVGANFAFRGYWNGVNKSRLYLRTLVVMHVCNVVFNYAFIFGELGAPALGATGAGLGTTLSTFIGTAYYVHLGRRHARVAGFLHGIPAWSTLQRMIKLSLPSGVQQLFFAAGMTALFSIVGRVGTAELAAANVLIQITLVALLPGLALGLAAASLVGQALGRGDVADAERWGWDVVRIAMVIMGALGLPMLLLPQSLLSAFFSSEPAVMAVAVTPLRLVGAFMIFDALGMVLLNALMGSGATRLAMVVSIATQWGLFLPVAYLVGPVLEQGLLGIWIANIGYRALLAVTVAYLWRSRRWAAVEV